MQRVCFTIRVRPERMHEYKCRHREVWPAMCEALRESGWTNYSLFLRDDGLLVGYFEAEDFERARQALLSKPVNARWQREMAAFFDEPINLQNAAPLSPLEEIFHLA